MRKLFFLFILFCLGPSLSFAQTTYPATTCNQADVLAAISKELMTPVDGDIITIPICPSGVSWAVGITKTFTNSVTIQGAGAISSTDKGAATIGTDQTVLVRGLTGSSAHMMDFTTVAGKSFRMTGIAVDENTTRQGPTNGNILIEGTSTSVRVDHMHFHVPAAGGQGIEFGGGVQGVADHNNYTTDTIASVIFSVLFYNGQLWNGDTQGNGDGSWADAPNWGTSKFIFVEDSRFFNTGVCDAEDGARFVFRYNTVTGDTSGNDSQQMYWHGAIPGNKRGAKEAEVYKNTFISNSTSTTSSAAFSMNSGSVLFWGNSVSGNYRYAMNVEYNFRNCIFGATSPCGNTNYDYSASWKYCGTSANGGVTNPWDGNNNLTSGYPCFSQPGRGQGDLITGVFPSKINSVTGTVAWPHEKLTPIYSWMNTYTSVHYGGQQSTFFEATAGTAGISVMVNNRDYFYECGTLNSFANPSCGLPFTGVAGTGFGLLSARPTSCATNSDPMGVAGVVTGVAYWETDNNVLDFCIGTSVPGNVNGWSTLSTNPASYTPYVYPHPLNTSGSIIFTPAPPTNLGSILLTSNVSTVITVTNQTSSPVVLSSPYATISGANASDFFVDGTGTCHDNLSLAANASCTISVDFIANIVGGESATLTLSGTTASNSLQGVGLLAQANSSCALNGPVAFLGVCN